LSDITLFWMMANVEDIVAIDTKYLFSLLQPNASWGAQAPHDSKTGIFSLADTIQRQIPISFNPVTHESIHPSILEQGVILPQLKSTLATYPDLIGQLMPLEQQAKQQWPHISQHMKEDTINAVERPRRDDTTRSIGTLSQRQEATPRMTIDQLSSFKAGTRDQSWYFHSRLGLAILALPCFIVFYFQFSP